MISDAHDPSEPPEPVTVFIYGLKEMTLFGCR